MSNGVLFLPPSKGWGSPPTFVRSFISHMASASFSVLVEGTSTSLLKMNEELDRGTQLSPILFDSVIDVLSRLIQNKIAQIQYECMILIK